jgi:NADP-dependent 3-hydroxy acid dehydrogenase YdfG
MIKDKIAIITGASSGIGYAAALTLSKAGAKVAIGARRTDKLESLKNEIEKNGGQVLAQKLDVTNKADCDSFVDAKMGDCRYSGKQRRSDAS